MFTVILSIITNCGGFLLKNWKISLIVLLVGLFSYQMFSPDEFLFGLGTVRSEEAKYKQAQHDVDVLKEQVKTTEAANQGLSAALTDQNERIQGWNTLSKKIDDSTQQLISQITKSQVQSKLDVTNILNKPTPQTCEQAVGFLRDAINTGNISWKK